MVIAFLFFASAACQHVTEGNNPDQSADYLFVTAFSLDDGAVWKFAVNAMAGLSTGYAYRNVSFPFSISRSVMKCREVTAS